jgi:hypothetical protein
MAKEVEYKVPAEAGELVKVQTDRPSWKVSSKAKGHEKCRTSTARGWLIDRINMPPAADGREWACYVMRLTAPCFCVDRDNKIVTAQVDDEILVPATYQLDDTVQGVATSLRFVGYFEIKFRDEIPAKKGDMVRYHIERGARPRPRENFCLPPSAGRSPALPPGLSGDAAEAEVPF